MIKRVNSLLRKFKLRESKQKDKSNHYQRIKDCHLSVQKVKAVTAISNAGAKKDTGIEDDPIDKSLNERIKAGGVTQVVPEKKTGGVAGKPTAKTSSKNVGAAHKDDKKEEKKEEKKTVVKIDKKDDKKKEVK